MPIQSDSGHLYDSFVHIEIDRSFESASAQAVRTTQGLAKPAQMNFIEKIIHFFLGSEKATAHAEQVKPKATQLVSTNHLRARDQALSGANGVMPDGPVRPSITISILLPSPEH